MEILSFDDEPCRSIVFTSDVGYTLFTNDPLYTSQGSVLGNDYRSDPGPRVYGKSRARYKLKIESPGDLEMVDGNIIVDNGNSSRPFGDEKI